MAWISHDFPHLFEDLFDAAVQFRFGIRRDQHLGSDWLRTMTSKLLAQGFELNVAFVYTPSHRLRMIYTDVKRCMSVHQGGSWMFFYIEAWTNMDKHWKHRKHLHY